MTTTASGARPARDAFEFMRLLWALDHALQSKSKRMLSTLGVTGPQRLVVRAVGRQPGISAGALASLLHLHPSTLTGVLSRLVERRLLERWGDPSDSRRALFRLRARGRKVDAIVSGTVEGAVRRVLAGQSVAAMGAAARVIAALGAELAAPETRPVTRRAAAANGRARHLRRRPR